MPYGNFYIFLFAQNIILGVSRIVDEKEKNHWDGIKRLINETPEVILHTLWEYLMTLATNQHDTYTDPFEIVTSNLGTYERLEIDEGCE